MPPPTPSWHSPEIQSCAKIHTHTHNTGSLTPNKNRKKENKSEKGNRLAILRNKSIFQCGLGFANSTNQNFFFLLFFPSRFVFRLSSFHTHTRTRTTFKLGKKNTKRICFAHGVPNENSWSNWNLFGLLLMGFIFFYLFFFSLESIRNFVSSAWIRLRLEVQMCVSHLIKFLFRRFKMVGRRCYSLNNVVDDRECVNFGLLRPC